MNLIDKIHTDDKGEFLTMKLDIPTAKLLLENMRHAQRLVEDRFKALAAEMVEKDAEPQPEFKGGDGCPLAKYESELWLVQMKAQGAGSAASELDHFTEVLYGALEHLMEDWEHF
jgi:hypothetical protein